MKIVHVCSTSAVSGANRYAFDIAAGQAELGHSVRVCAPEQPGDSLKFEQNGAPARIFGTPYAWSMIRAVGAEKPDIIHCHGGKSARWLRYMPTRPPSMITIHSVYKPKYMSHLDGLHYLADWQEDMVSAFPGPRQKVNNWTPNLPPSGFDGAMGARALAGAAPTDFLVGFLGRLDSVKGADDLISAFRKCGAPRLRLALVGEGTERERLETLTADDARIRFVGYSNRPGDWYRAFDLLVMPSHHEPFALVALEAMALETPLITADLQGFQEILRDHDDRRLDTTDPDTLAEAIDAAASLKMSDSVARFSYDMERFDRARGIRAVTDFYHVVIAAKTGAR